jgi:hypothetical protein
VLGYHHHGMDVVVREVTSLVPVGGGDERRRLSP